MMIQNGVKKEDKKSPKNLAEASQGASMYIP